MKKITITNAYTWYNKGDAGILLGTVDLLKTIYDNDVSFDVLSLTPDVDRVKYCKDKSIKNVYSNILNPRPYKNTILGKCFAVFKLLLKFIFIQTFLLFGKKDKLIKKYKSIECISNSDLVIVCGGGFLGGNKLDSLIHIYQIYIDTIFCDNVIILGTSIEPMSNRIVKKLTERVIKKVNYIFAREKITYDLLESIISKDRYELIPDMAFMLNAEKTEKRKKETNITCGLTVRNWNFPKKKNPKKMMENYINTIVNTIDYFYNEENIQFVFIPQVIVSNGNDTDIARVIKSRLKKEEALIIVENDYTPGEIKGIISECDIFLGTRMHSNIFATSSSIPTVAIAYEKKTNGIMHTVGLDECVLEINDIDFRQVKEKIYYVLNNKERIINMLNRKIPMIQYEIVEKVKKKIGD